MRRSPFVVRLGASILAVLIVTAGLHVLVDVNPTTVALSYVVLILFVATGWGIAEAMTASLTAVTCFNLFFLPPVGTLTIANPQNWVALIAFLVTALVASQLSGRARQRTLEAESRQRDLERLYTLSRALLLADGGTSIQQVIVQRIAEAFDLPGVAMYDERADLTTYGGHVELRHLDGHLKDVARQGRTFQETAGTVVIAIRLGGAPIGSLAIAGGDLMDTVLQSVANLAAIGLERARSQESTTRANAARESGELRAAVLDALAHEFKTPLTSMKVAAGELQSSPCIAGGRDRELVAILAEELDRLHELVNDAVQMLRIDAGTFAVHPDRLHVADVVTAAIRKQASRLQDHQVTVTVPEDLVVEADPGLLGLALDQLLDNAVKYSPPTSTIAIVATGGDTVRIGVRNSGRPIPEREQGRIFDRFYRGVHSSQTPGTGMGLAIVRQIAQAHGGTASVSSSVPDLTEFTITLPRGGVR